MELVSDDNAPQVAQALRLSDGPGVPRQARKAIAAAPAKIGDPVLVLRKLLDEGRAGDDDTRGRGTSPDHAGGVPPPGEGVDTEEAEPIGSTLRLDHLTYTPQITRQLNSHIAPDQALVGGRRPGPGRLWLASFLRVCNNGHEVRKPSDRLALVGAFGRRFAPTELPASNPFQYDPRPLAPGECLPRKGSVSDQVIEGSLVLFEIPVDVFSERPVALEVEGDSGQRERVIVDL